MPYLEFKWRSVNLNKMFFLCIEMRENPCKLWYFDANQIQPALQVSRMPFRNTMQLCVNWQRHAMICDEICSSKNILLKMAICMIKYSVQMTWCNIPLSFSGSNIIHFFLSVSYAEKCLYSLYLNVFIRRSTEQGIFSFIFSKKWASYIDKWQSIFRSRFICYNKHLIVITCEFQHNLHTRISHFVWYITE